MAHVFKMITLTEKDTTGHAGVAIGISVKIAGKETLCPVTRVCNSMDSLELEIESLKDDLSNILTGAKGVLEGSSPEAVIEFEPDMTPGEIWTILLSITKEKMFMEAFNKMDDQKRKEVADYVLSECNMFSGKGALFSSRYDNITGLIE